MLHLSTNDEYTICGRPLGELSIDAYTSDPDGYDCPECADRFADGNGESFTGAGNYVQGYVDGKEKGYFELEHWLPDEHSPGCGCRPCFVAKSVINKVLGR